MATILLIAFIIICVLLIAIVLIQNEEGDGLGGLLGGANTSTFGSRSGNVITKTTYVLVVLFFLSSFGLALINKAPTVKPLEDDESEAEKTEWFSDGTEVAPVELNSADTASETTQESAQ